MKASAMRTETALLLTAGVLALLLAGCGKPHVNYSSSSQTQDSAPPASSYPANHTARLPSGQGGYHKTGKSYKVRGHRYYPLATADGYNETGTASWYGTKFHGKKTANGERYDMYAMSAAHKTLPLPTMVRVTNLNNGRSVVVRVNDRGPFAKGRLIDLSYAAAKTLAYDHAGTAPVRVEVLGNTRAAYNHKKASNPVQNTPIQRVSLPRSETTPSALTGNNRGMMYIQLGAFASRNNAKQLQTSLQDEYPSVQVYTKNGGYSELYRVRVGPFHDVKNIENKVLSLQEQGHVNAIVVIE